MCAVAEKAGVAPHTVRYYERLGLLPAPGRSANGYRIYHAEAVDRLRFIRGAKRLGLRLDDVAELLEVMDRGQCPCGDMDTLLRRRLAEITSEIDELVTLRDELHAVLDAHPVDDNLGPGADDWWCRQDFTTRR